jgi:hypothetical protein
MIGVEKIGQIRRAYFERHRSIKEIVRTLSVSRATVRKVIRGHKTEFKYERGVQPTPKLGDWVEILTEILEQMVRAHLQKATIISDRTGGLHPRLWVGERSGLRRQNDDRPARSPDTPLRHRRDRQRQLALQEPRLTPRSPLAPRQDRLCSAM